MREIKFRAWIQYDETHAEMLPNVQNHINGEWAFGNLLYANNAKVMQYTGLKDKNDIEIYEGDILLIDCDDEYYRSSVYFDGGALCIDVKGCDFDFTAVGWAIGCNTNVYSLEVIGNIHQNPELLNN